MDFLTSAHALHELQLPSAGPAASKSAAKRKSDASTGADDDDDYAPTSKPATKKPRVSKAKAVADPHAQAKQLVQAIITNPNGFAVPSDQAAMRAQFVLIAQYASALSAGEAAGAEGTRIVKAMSEDELEAAAAKLAKAALSQIKKQMVVSARSLLQRTRSPDDAALTVYALHVVEAELQRWLCQVDVPGRRTRSRYVLTSLKANAPTDDLHASQPAIFQCFMQLPEPPKYKATKITLEQLYDILDTNYIETSIRYGSLRITSPNINVKWNKESGEFSLSGTYGL